MSNFPTSVSTNANLYIAVNGLQTTLAASISNSDTTIQLTSTTSFPTTGLVTIDNAEVVSYTGISGANLTGCTRGADGTTATSHNTGVTVGATIVAAHHNLLKDEVIAIETSLGAGYLQASANTANAVVQRDGSGNFSAGTITASLTGAASSNLLKAGDTMTGDITMSNQKGIIFKEPTGTGTDFVKVEAPDDVTTSYTLKLPPAVASAGQVLTDAVGNGVLSWASPGSGTVTNVSGTTNQITSTNPTTTPVLALANPLTLPGAMTAGGDIAMATHKVTGLGNGSAAQDAVAFTQVLGTRILQVQTASTSTQSTSTSSTYADATNLTVSITPSLSTSTIYLFASVNSFVGSATTGKCSIGLQFVRGSTVIQTFPISLAIQGASAINNQNQVQLFYHDSPATTSSTTYKIQFNNNDAATCAVNLGSIFGATPTSTIYAIEVG